MNMNESHKKESRHSPLMYVDGKPIYDSRDVPDNYQIDYEMWELLEERTLEAYDETMQLLKEDGPDAEPLALAARIENRLLSDPNYQLEAPEAWFLICKYVTDEFHQQIFYSNGDLDRNALITPWSEVDFRDIADKYQEDEPVIERTSSVNFTEEEETSMLIRPAILKMDPRERVKLSELMAKHLKDFSPHFTYTMETDYSKMMLGGMDLDSEEMVPVGKHLVKFFDQIIPDNQETDQNYYLIDELVHWQNADELMLRSLTEIDETPHNFWRVIFYKNGFAGTVNRMRELIDQASVSDKEKLSALLDHFWQGVKVNGKRVYSRGFDDIYREVGYYNSESHTEKESTERLPKHKAKLDKYGITSEDPIVIVACGRGSLVHKFKVRGGYENVYGFDISSDAIDVAKELDRDTAELFKQGSWDNPESFIFEGVAPKVTIADGRDIHHRQGIEAAQRVAQIEADLGVEVVIFTAIDPTTGAQAQRLNRIRSVMESMNLERDWLDENFWDATGSMDGVHFGNRWTPPKEWWQLIYESAGYDVEIEVEEDYDGEGTNNLVFYCRRIHDPQREYQVSLKAREELSALPRERLPLVGSQPFSV